MEEQKHISTAFDKDLSELNAMVQKLGSLAITQFETAIDALATQHMETLDHVISNDAKLDELEAAINEKAVEVIALRSPHARDLRQVLVALKIATILERTGDYARNIANRTRVIAQAGNENIPGVNIGRRDRSRRKCCATLCKRMMVMTQSWRWRFGIVILK